MFLKVLFWSFAALDLAAIALWFVLGLAAAGPSKTNPLTVVFLLLLLPGLIVGAAIALHLRTESAALRTVALLVVGSPVLVLGISHATARIVARFDPNAFSGETDLTRALRALPEDPGQLTIVRTLLANGADPNAGAQPPLALAIYASRKAGTAALESLLTAGADPNARDAFGRPAWFAATSVGIDVAVVRLLLERGADLQARGRDGRSAAWSATDTRNWPVATLLVQRGAGVDGRSPMGMSLRDTLEGHVRVHGDGGGVAELLAAVRERG